MPTVSNPAAPAPPSFGEVAAPSLFDRPLVFWALALAGLASFLWHEGTFGDVVQRLALPDNDDAMRLVGIRDLLAGQGWFDPIQHRYLPPGGGSMHWSRFVDAPLAAAILALTPALGRELAEGIVVAAWPPLLLLFDAAVIACVTQRLFGPRAAAFAVFALSQSAFALIFVPGRIDHHNVQATLILLMGLRLCRSAAPSRAAAVAGALAALSLAVGLETLPFVAVAGFVVVARWIAAGEPASRPLVAFAGALALSSAVVFALQTDPGAWSTPRCDALSPPWLLVTLGAGAVAACLAAAGVRLRSWPARAAAAGILGAILVAAFALSFPDCLHGPFAALPPLVKSVWLEQVREALPIWRAAALDPLASIPSFGPLLVAAIVAAVGAFRSREHRRVLEAHAAFLWTGVLVCLVQMRGAYIAAVFLPLVAGWTFDRAIAALRTPAPAATRAALVAASLLLLGRIWGIGVLVAAPAGSTSGEAGFPDGTWAACTDRSALRELDRLPPGTVLAPIDLGANILLQTRHAIVAAPYHRNIAGIVAGIEAFAGSEADMRRAALRHGADYVMLCRSWLPQRAGAGASFAGTLAAGARADWLEPVDLGPGPLAAWRVRKP